MSERHVALIVEDEPEMAAEIGDLLRALGHDYVHAETLADARVLLEQGGFCYALVDLEIKADRQSIKPRVESGMSVLRELRERFPARKANDMHLVPVLVVSGHGRDPHNVIGAFKGGIDDFILRPRRLSRLPAGRGERHGDPGAGRRPVLARARLRRGAAERRDVLVHWQRQSWGDPHPA